MGTTKVSEKVSEASPWRSLFETVRGALHNRRDEQGVVGSINWLRQGMKQREANPNVVRNIIYRNKGKLADKRVLFALLSELWESTGGASLEAPEIELLLRGAPDEGEAAQLLGRDKRRIYQGFIGAVRSGGHPKLLVTGRPGSGKTLLTDFVQGALEDPSQSTLPGKPEVVRQEFSAANLADALLHLSLALGAAPEVFETKLSKIGVAGAFSVQADAQADVARVVLERLRARRDPLVLLLHVSQSAGNAQPGTLGDAPLRLNTPDVPRVGLTEWLWHTLLEPMGRLNQLSLLLSMAELPLTLVDRAGMFEGPVKLSPPTTAEARRFVRALAPQLPTEQQEDLLGRAKRSFEDLRTLTLLAEAREPLGAERDTEQLSRLVAEGSGRIRDFLGVLAVLSLPEFPAVTQEALMTLRSAEPEELSSLELAFLDAVPGEPGCWRPFSRQFSRTLRNRFRTADLERFRSLSLAASRLYEDDANRAPRSDAAGRYVHHLFAARAWPELIRWAEHAPVPQSLLGRLWRTAQTELRGDPTTFCAVALQVAAYYVRLGSTEHPGAVGALEVLAGSGNPRLAAWALVKRAESAALQGRYRQAETLLAGWHGTLEPSVDPGLEVEVALLRAALARWHSRLADAATLVVSSAETLEQMGEPQDPLLTVRVGLWTGIATKDKGDLEGALEHFRGVSVADELLRARVRFQEADVLLSLGRLAEAHTALSDAVTWSYGGEAPAFERARYLARRGTLRRRQGDLGAAHADFAAAHAVLSDSVDESESPRLGFEQAKVRDEEALNFLAEGRMDDAIAALQGDLETFAAYGEHYGVDPSFRVLRGTLRLAMAYGCRAFGEPYRLPPGPYAEDATSPDLQLARRLVLEVINVLTREPGRYAGLATQAQLGSSVLLLPGDAVTQAEAALTHARYPYGRGLTGTFYAGALLRRGDFSGAHDAVLAAQRELQRAATDDHALCSYLTVLHAGVLLSLDDHDGAHGRILAALQQLQLRPYHDVLLRRFGSLTERLEVTLETAALGLGETPLPRTLRPADALVLRWQQRANATKSDAAEPTEQPG